MLQKMRKKSSLKSKETVTFKLQFRATSVPRTWEKLQLQVSVVPANGTTGKGGDIAKTGKATVKDGTCHWYEPMFESIQVSRSLNGVDAEKVLHYRLIVSTGSSLFGILGEAHVDFREHLGIAEPVSLALQLENCKFGSVLHVQIWHVMTRSSGRYRRTETLGDRQNSFDSTPIHNNGDAIAHPSVMDDFGDHMFLSSSSSHSGSPRRDEEDNSHGKNQRLSNEMTTDKNVILTEEKDASGGSSSAGRWNYSDGRASNHDEERYSSYRGTNQLGRSQGAVLEDGFTRGAYIYDNLTRKSADDQSQRWHSLLIKAQVETTRRLLSNEIERHKQAEEYLSSSIAKWESAERKTQSLKTWGKSREEDEGIQKRSQLGSCSGTVIKLQELEDELASLKSENSSISLQLQKAQESNTELLSEIEDLKKLVLEEEVRMEASKSKVSELVDLVERLRTELEEAEQESLKLKEDKLSLITSLTNAANEKLKEKDDVIARLENEIGYIVEECLSVNLVAMDSIRENIRSYKDTDEVQELRGATKTLEEHLREEETEMTEQIYDDDDDEIKALPDLQKPQLQLRNKEQLLDALETSEAEMNSNQTNASVRTARWEEASKDAVHSHDHASASTLIRTEMMDALFFGEELQHKTGGSTAVERGYAAEESPYMFHAPPPYSRANSFIGSLPLEGDAASKEAHPSSTVDASETLDRQSDKQHEGPPSRVAHSNSKVYQALKQLNELATQNLTLFQHSNDLLATLASKESELAFLKKEKMDLESAILRSNPESPNTKNLNRVLALENELAEALEANDMYKSQLQSAFAKHQVVNAVALETAESVEQVIKDISRLKRENVKLADELGDLQKRYFNMSLQFAEVEAERGELVMTIRNLRGNRKLMPYQSVKF